MTKRILVCFAVALVGVATVSAQVLTLDSCRALALNNNKELQMSQLKRDAAYWQHKSVQTNYLPKISAVGTYQRTSKEVSLLNKHQKQVLSHAGSTMAGAIGEGVQQGAAAFQQHLANLPSSPEFQALMRDPQIQAILAQNPQLAQMLANPSLLQQMAAPYLAQASTAFNGMLTSMAQMVDGAGQSIVDAFRTDTRNMTGAAVMLTQPLYMGGKIRAYDRITRLAQEAAGEQYTMQEQDLLVSVDEAYWRIVALQSKKKLAESFLTTVKKLDGDVDKLIAEGMATKADGLSVKVKVNEAEVAMIQVDNGLALSRMALAQICGLPMDANFTLEDETEDVSADGALQMSISLQPNADRDFAVETALAHRAEIRALDIAAQVKREEVKVARSEYMPNLALTAGYLVSNPNVFNGFEKKFNGMWSAGVVLKVPIVTWGDRIYKVRQAKAEAAMAETRVDEVREKITLQVNQNKQKMQEAQRRLSTALRSQEQADENLRMANLGMREGVIPVSNVLQAQTAWLSAHSTLVEAAIDVRLADLYLMRALGTLSK
ncbi:MAG: TolC family protein [Bacteroidaceae bacterium]|nr:TolC family protein [Bacteroidaceae bacterium]MBR0432683.1 TolC family protein [Bacteroidaceae bacterium]